ncbi:ASPIC/UnbV domain protein [Gemmatirosa kalamazoonensis]|uniref:ASPIC/UnbV domain protein n=1 Tax=Gemmatirosa kalamazoonensis TaxID=861299 RepID=W0RKE8_9BACT|nr:CRTAC1 family protein [Gemmatirosa kalamazoonensis]AHG91569.1 ASPIC/UnbV domain protein [Gemmatirosa kalamazoonensis]
MRIGSRPRLVVVLLSLVALVVASACREKPKRSVAELMVIRGEGLARLSRGELPEAEAQFKQLTELAPDDPLGYTDLGLTYLQEGRLAEAEAPLRRARKLDPASIDAGLALAKLLALTKRTDDARELLESLRKGAPRDAHVLYALAQLDAKATDAAGAARYEQRLRDVLGAVPANLAVKVELAAALARRGAADAAVQQLEELRRTPPEAPEPARMALDSALLRLRAGQVAEARTSIDRLARALELTAPYQASLDAVRWVEGPLVGRQSLTFSPKDFITLRTLARNDSAAPVRFVDATSDAGIAPGAQAPNASGSAPAVLAAGDVDGDGTDEYLVAAWSAAQRKSVARLYNARGGLFADVSTRSALALPDGVVDATFADVDNDGWLDLFAIGGDGRGRLLRNRGDGRFEDVTAKAGVGDVRGARRALFVDLDHDGDLDLVLVGGAQRTVYRNNLDGTFTEATAAFGLTGGEAREARDVAFGDFDGDGRVDLFVAGVTDMLFRNDGASRLRDATAESGVASTGSTAVAVGDYDNDGALDVLVAGANGAVLWHNHGDGTFARDARAEAGLAPLRGTSAAALRFLDYDNDGWLDVVAVGAAREPDGRGVVLLHNERGAGFVDRASALPDAVRAATAVLPTDVDDDGDLDLLLADASGDVRLLRNVNGNHNLALNVQLKALRTGSGKNNDFGIGARLELRAGELQQTRVVTDRVTHFGLGPHLKADVLRTEWPNGMPQTIYFPGTDQDVLEMEALKGSCAFAYTWDGTRFRFVTDAMWRSALGMPLGLMAGGRGSAFAPAGASQEYVRIPGDALRPKDGRYLLQLTEELWETAYADEVKLLTVDHPDSVDVFVDERFVPPGPPLKLRLYQVARRQAPRSAVDERGTDVLPALLKSDDVYVSDLTPTRYQGVVEPHDLVLDLGDEAGKAGTALFLRGWIYPTDASINVALSQQSAVQAVPPSLEVRDARGRWVTAIASLGFPSGKDKTMVIELGGLFPTSDHHVRLRTTMQIYWDQAFVAADVASSPTTIATLAPTSADLHYRGFSRTYRKGGRYGPYWFAYDDVTKASPWRAITGAFTRFGDVRSLVGTADDMYVVMAPGDETTLAFDASSERALPKGWKRDFLLYTDGWIKDSDLNTAHGTTVGPLPFHAVKSYPYGPGDAYPTDPMHARFLREYQTRVVGRR